MLLGDSAGGQLAVLAALRPDAFRTGCTAAPVKPAAVVALAGAFDLTDIAFDLFGASERERPELWHEGDVFAWVHQRPELPVLLVHGRDDQIVAASTTARLGADLSAAGHAVQTTLLPEVTHGDIYQPAVVLPILLKWLTSAELATQ